MVVQNFQILDEERQRATGDRSRATKTGTRLTFLNVESKKITGYAQSNKGYSGQEIAEIVVEASENGR